jgi:hypothetical protein
MKKVLYTLAVDGYEPDITAMTFPLMERYCEKIGADFHIITERKYPDLPPVYEKFQIYNLAKKNGADWHLFFDADALLHPDLFDITSVLNKDTTCSFGSDFVPVRFRPDQYFLRDGRMIGKGNWCGIASDWCLDYWLPLTDISFEEAVSNIYPTQDESSTVIKREHLIDDYVVSRNIARFGLKHVLIPDLYALRGMQCDKLWHQYLYGADRKIVEMQNVLKAWGLR